MRPPPPLSPLHDATDALAKIESARGRSAEISVPQESNTLGIEPRSTRTPKPPSVLENPRKLVSVAVSIYWWPGTSNAASTTSEVGGVYASSSPAVDTVARYARSAVRLRPTRPVDVLALQVICDQSRPPEPIDVGRSICISEQDPMDVAPTYAGAGTSGVSGDAIATDEALSGRQQEQSSYAHARLRTPPIVLILWAGSQVAR